MILESPELIQFQFKTTLGMSPSLSRGSIVNTGGRSSSILAAWGLLLTEQCFATGKTPLYGR